MGRQGGKARAAQPDFAEHQRRAGRRSAQVNDMSALGHRGAMAYIQKYGYARLYRLARAWRLGHPSRHEQAVMALLDSLGLAYEREAEVLGENAFVSVDFFLPGLAKAIEVNGKVHFDPLFDDPRYPQTRQANDAERLRCLQAAGFEIMVIDYRDLADADAVRRQVAEFVKVR
jgi:very-short-patch-repair endonuclease